MSADARSRLVRSQNVRDYCRAAAPGVQWESAAIDKVVELADAFVQDLVAYAALRRGSDTGAKNIGRRITLRDVNAAAQEREGAYAAWLEECNELLARACPVKPLLPPAPVTKKRKIADNTGAE